MSLLICDFLDASHPHSHQINGKREFLPAFAWRVVSGSRRKAAPLAPFAPGK
jgi:hypothetical protein